MTKDMLTDKYLKYKEQLFPCYMEIEKESFAEYAFGYFYDDQVGKWKVFVNKDRDTHRIRCILNSEEDAVEKVNSILDYKLENIGLI
jgi:hypothetical protein